jgi:hypothetical protein
MAKQRLFPESNDKRAPQKRFEDTASKVFSVPKSEIDERERRWRARKSELPKRDVKE